MRYIALIILSILFLTTIHAQKTKTSAEIMEGFKKLKVVGSVLYIAAHPDDENTRLITNLVKEHKLQTAYLSLTRGDGGQNLIGPELDEYLGVIRTNELMEARKIDGGIQYFTRANDFGYSKNAEETFTFWNKDSILADVLRVIREFKPDVIINRFDHRSTGKTHGHHTASAILGLEAGQHANSPLFMKDALKGTDMHPVQRILFNTSWFFFGGKEKFDAMDKSGLYSLDAGSYYPAYGYSNNEIAAQSRSMHKSQGFGINSSRGTMLEYFERVDGIKESQHKSPFDGLNLTWSRINGGGNVDKLIDSLITFYNYEKPWLSIPLLQKIEEYILDLNTDHWKKIKLEEVRNLIFDCAGLFTECFTDKSSTTSNSSLQITTECIVRNPASVQLESISIPVCKKDTTMSFALISNQAFIWNAKIELPSDLPVTSPFWLWNGRPRGMYNVDALSDYTLPMNKRILKSHFKFLINGKSYTIEKDIIYKNDDPVLGEVKQNLDIIPKITIIPEDHLFVSNSKKTKCRLKLIANADKQSGRISLKPVDNFSISPSELSYDLEKTGDQKEFEFEVTSKINTNKLVEFPVLVNNKPAHTLESIKYPHIPWLNVLVPAQIKLINTEILKTKKRIAYIEGAGDYIDEALHKMGFDVKIISASELPNLSINNFDVLVFGIRALNTQQELKYSKRHLERFMTEGGKVIFQYNTTAELITDDFAPATLKISRDRVTDENAKIRMLQPAHPILNTPNKIQAADFDNWVQERGLYFPNNYDSTYVELLAMNDPNEKELKSGILVKKVGKGWFVYSPLAWFRQLKAGVPGAYRLFANMVCF
jgi:LmbE family N-acetylglucosaminyl deacetylase